MYCVPVLHTGTQYRYCVPVRTCKHTGDMYAINVKNKVYKKTVIGDVVTHLKLQKITFRQICNVLFHHYSASSILLST